ncbi:DUF255 domain-containing protein [Flavobacterium alkalisoli]|uniref:DUF255 domain-containing protein n=1 Tax=Flavobacterium alkalisoli TaxID=2602769 RepID=A0A5B9FQI6_9FLAO|nr:thioredoxin fold domain-containing protein [Flavobacterium alkalisoli]QEE49234.1 DUF255 domain-containing protein [Flavobacterium alkalisoli]
MKKLLLVLFVALGSVAAKAQEIKWMTFDEAQAAQKKSPKPIFMDVYTDWCGPCKILDKQTFHDPKVIEFISKNYYAVKFNAEGQPDVTYKGKKYSNPGYVEGRKGRNATHEFTRILNLQGYPTMMVFDKKGEIINTIVGLHTPEQLLTALQEE